MKRILLKIAKMFLIWSSNYIYNKIDTDSDGKISKKELKSLINKIEKLKKGF